MKPYDTIGIVGLGLLGSAIAERLIAAGYEVIGFDTDVSRQESPHHLGVTFVESLAETSTAECLLLSLPDATISTAVCDELSQRLSPGTVILDTTTGDPATMTDIANRLDANGIQYLDTCIGGSSEQCRNGEVIAMVGGDRDAFNTSQPVLDSFATQSFHLGPAGSGAKMKLVVNLILGLNRAVLAEGLALAKQFSLDLPTTLEVLQAGPAASKALETKGRKMIEGDFTPQARLSQHRKDVGLILDAAEQSNAALPFSVMHAELLDRLIAAGFGDEDNSAIVRAFGVD